MHCSPFRDADLILRIICTPGGKLSLLARGARRSGRRFNDVPDIFDRGIFEYSKGKGSLLELRSFQPARPFSALRDDLDKLAAAAVVAEGFDLLVHENAAETGQPYEILQLGLEAISQAACERQVMRGCFISLAGLLEQSGFSDHGSFSVPSANNFTLLVARIEECAERQLRSKKAALDLIDRIRKKARPPMAPPQGT